MSIDIVIAFSNMLFSEGIVRLLDGEKDLVIKKVLEAGKTHSAETLSGLAPDVILTDLTSLYNSFPDAGNPGNSHRFILVDTNCGRENIVSAVLNKKVAGVLLAKSDAALLKKSIRSVAKGDIWIDKKTVKNLLTGINAIGPDKNSVLTEREREIVGLVGKGYRNKEIAQKLHISEPTVKTHLRKVFQKLHVRTRSEIITYAVKHHAIES